jgi:Ca2+-binding EF-hand superfamily protein
MTSENSPGSINQFKFNNLSSLNKQTLTSYQLIEVEQAFETFDLNNRGYLDPYQFKVTTMALHNIFLFIYFQLGSSQSFRLCP